SAAALAVHTTMRPPGYHSAAAGSAPPAGRASSVRYPIHQAGKPMPSRNAIATDPLVATASPNDAITAASRPAGCVQPIAASMMGSWAKLASANDKGEPDAIEANSNADAAPAPKPMRTICIIASCPALRAVRGGSSPQPSAARSVWQPHVTLYVGARVLTQNRYPLLRIAR